MKLLSKQLAVVSETASQETFECLGKIVNGSETQNLFQCFEPDSRGRYPSAK